MWQVRQTRTFVVWLRRLRDNEAKLRISRRLVRLSNGHFGDAKQLGGGVGEIRIDYGPGYRLYYSRSGRDIIVLLCGGDKGSQDRDISIARKLAADETE